MTKQLRNKIKERSNGICELCNKQKATQIHHVKLKSQGGLDILINLIHVCNLCHNHDDIQFLRDCKDILKQRAEKLFLQGISYHIGKVAELLETTIEVVTHEIYKGWLKSEKVEIENPDTKQVEFVVDYCKSEDILFWLGVK